MKNIRNINGGRINMIEKIAKLIDVKSLVTLTLIAVLAFVVVYYVVTNTMTDNVFLLFSNVVTMIITYFFAKEKFKTEEITPKQ